MPALADGGLFTGLAERLLVTSLTGGALAAAVWALCRLVPALPPRWRSWLWWAVAAKLVLGLLPLPSLSLAVPMPAAGAVGAVVEGSGLFASPAETTAAAVGLSADGAERESARGAAATATSPALPGAATARGVALAAGDRGSATAVRRAVGLLLALWALGVLAALLAAAADGWRARRLVRASRPLLSAELQAVFERLCRELGIRRAALRLSDEVPTPLVTGIVRPVVLLPAAAQRALGGAELEMVLAHELAHVARRDLLLGLLPAFAARLFFFHPLARLAAREHALAREAACDAFVVARFAPSPRDYGRLLLRLALPARRPLRAAAAAITHHTLQRRLEMLLADPRRFRPAPAWLAAGALLVALVPLRLTAAAPAEEPVVAAATAPTLAATAGPGSRPVATLARLDEARIYRDDDDGFAYVLTRGESHTMDGRRGDLARAERLRRGDEDLLWVRLGGSEWVVRDPALLAEAAALFAEQRELGARQGELGAAQGELGAQQAELGRHQAELGKHQAELAGQQAELAMEMARLAVREAALGVREMSAVEAERRALEEERQTLERSRRPLEEQMQELGRRQGELGARQGELGGRQGELGERQGELGERQGELGRRQSEASERAHQAMRALVERLIAEGKAERVRD